MTDQLVLTISLDLVNTIRGFQGYTHDVDIYLSEFLRRENNLFVNRSTAEVDYARKQLIPYVVLRFEQSVFAYIRGKRSTETRLVAFKSIGVGGHIEPTDQSLFSSDRDMYLEAARREVNEEVRLDSPYQEHIVALINDDSTDVGKVHLGIMHIWDLAEPKVTKREGLITQSGFVPIETLKANHDELETWSQIALRVLEDPAIPKWKCPVQILQGAIAKS